MHAAAAQNMNQAGSYLAAASDFSVQYTEH
jgi:hypothetical protein